MERLDKLILNKQKLFNNFEDKEIFKINNFENIIKKEIDFRDNRERLGEQNDRDLLGIRDFLREKGAIPRVEAPQIEILPGTVEVLAGFLAKEAQRDPQGRFRYLLTSELAVEVITGATRYHHDIDLVLFDYRNGWWTKYATDNVVADRYWADMKFDSAYLEETAWAAQFQTNGREGEVSTVHPVIILVQKLSNAWSRAPRERDVKDVKELVKFWQESQNSDPAWNSVIQAAIAALPEKEQPTTRERLSQYYQPKPSSCTDFGKPTLDI